MFAILLVLSHIGHGSEEKEYGYLLSRTHQRFLSLDSLSAGTQFHVAGINDDAEPITRFFIKAYERSSDPIGIFVAGYDDGESNHTDLSADVSGNDDTSLIVWNRRVYSDGDAAKGSSHNQMFSLMYEPGGFVRVMQKGRCLTAGSGKKDGDDSREMLYMKGCQKSDEVPGQSYIWVREKDLDRRRPELEEKGILVRRVTPSSGINSIFLQGNVSCPPKSNPDTPKGVSLKVSQMPAYVPGRPNPHGFIGNFPSPFIMNPINPMGIPNGMIQGMPDGIPAGVPGTW